MTGILFNKSRGIDRGFYLQFDFLKVLYKISVLLNADSICFRD